MTGKNIFCVSENFVHADAEKPMTLSKYPSDKTLFFWKNIYI